MKLFLSLIVIVLALAGCMTPNALHGLDPATAEADATRDISAGRLQIYVGRAMKSYVVGIPESLWYLARQAEIVELDTTCHLDTGGPNTVQNNYGRIYNCVVVKHLLELNGRSADDLEVEMRKTHK
ncbi:MAG: hypothetical protein ACREIA_09230 [Opitutaceae bacterium]